MNAVPLPAILANDPTKAPPCPRGVVYIPLREAHYRSGVPMETLARKCREPGGWAEKNLALILKPEDGGSKPTWHIREDCDARFARIKSPSALPLDWGKLTESQRQTVRRRKTLLDGWCEAREELMAGGASEREATDVFLFGLAEEQGASVSRETLFRWAKSYRAAGLVGLVDKRLEKSGRREGEEFIEELKRLYLNPRQKGVSLCYAMAYEKAEEQGWAIPFGYGRAKQIIRAIDPKIVALHRLGERAYDGRFGKHALRDYSAMVSNELWVSDGHDFNVFVDCDGKLRRPVLVSWLDVVSRYCVGFRISAGAENSAAILSAFRMGAEACGLPQGVYFDNGKSYRSKALEEVDLGVFERLEVRVRHAKPYNAKAKIVERWHRTLDERFSRRWETYTGGNTAVKPYDLEKQKAAGKAPTLEEFTAAFADWLTADYHNREHGGEGLEGKTPAQVYCDRLQSKRTMSADAMDLELCRRELATVGRNGVRISGITYEAPELDDKGGKNLVVLVDDQDIGRVKVLDEAGRILCVATSMRKVPANATGDELREAMASINRDKKRVKAAMEARPRMADDPIERMHRQAAEKAKTQPQPAPHSIKPFRSKLEAGLPAIRAAEQAARQLPDEGISIDELYDAGPRLAEREEYQSLAELYGQKEVG